MNATRPLGVQAVLRAILPQIILLCFVAALYLLSLAGVIPSPQHLNEILVRLFKAYGLPLIAASSFLENLVAVNAYFPGAFTILTGMSLTAGHPTQAILTYLAIYLPAYCANLISYFLGLSQKARLHDGANSLCRKKLWLWFFLTYWHPQLAATSAFSAGVHSSVPRNGFIVSSLIVSLFWSLFWAAIIYHFGLAANVARHFASLFILYVLVWAAIDIWKLVTKANLT